MADERLDAEKIRENIREKVGIKKTKPVFDMTTGEYDK
jgi:hypothetical protein